ncbi:MAG: hypothetical protein Kow00127_23560 [Bacteroidales bacterium]
MMNEAPVIVVRDMVKKFGSFVANDLLTFDVYQGEIFGFLGANGAGKTTAIRILCGLLAPTSGDLSVAGYDVYSQSENIKQVIGYMSQKFSLYENLTFRENVMFYGGIYGLGKKEINARLKEFDEQLNLGEMQDQIISSLPLGWKQKLAFAVSMIHKPKIVFLDEPTGGVDPVTRRQFWNMIDRTAREGTTVFVTTHYMDEAEYCDRVCILVDGRIEALDTPKKLKSDMGVRNMDEVFLKIARKKQQITS